MDDYIAFQQIQVSKAEAKLEEERQKLQEAVQERKIQEKLRENAFEVFIREENARESKEVDELVSYTYGQKRR
jgi:flagellar FliJ protein